MKGFSRRRGNTSFSDGNGTPTQFSKNLFTLFLLKRVNRKSFKLFLCNSIQTYISLRHEADETF